MGSLPSFAFLRRKDLLMLITIKDIYKILPEDLYMSLLNTWHIPQNPKWHPEGNTLKHIIITVKRACDTNNKNLIMAALFHDLGKYETFKINDKTGQPTAYGHERVSCFYVYKFRDFIKSFGADPTIVLWIVKNHMKIKYLYDMKKSKRDKLVNHLNFLDLIRFRYEVDGGGRYELLIR